jgi:hypothetical protein
VSDEAVAVIEFKNLPQNRFPVGIIGVAIAAIAAVVPPGI